MPALLIACFLSGVAALAYELLWMRELALLAGSTQAAITCVLSIYFLGLALGNALAGRYVRRFDRPLRVYVYVELLIALWAIAFVPLLAGLDGIYAATYAALPVGSPWGHALRLASAAALLLVPTTAMGATIPLLTHFAARDLNAASKWSAWLYGVNTLGALTGTFITGFYVIELYGVRGPLMATGLINVACALCIWPLMNSRLTAKSDLSATPQALTPMGKLLLLSFGILGFCNLAAEVLWTQMFSIVFLNDTYIFTVILMVFLFGVGAGSLFGDLAFRRLKNPAFLLGFLQVLSAAWCVGTIYIVPAVAKRYMASEYFIIYEDKVRGYFNLAIVGALLPTLCMGASFPLLVRIVMNHHLQAGLVVGRALAWNTIGGVFGAAIAGFVILEHWDLQPGLYLIAALTAAVGLAICLSTPAGRRWTWLPASLLVAPMLALVLIKPVDLANDLVAMHFDLFEMSSAKIMESRSSVHGQVTITEEPWRTQTERRIWINSNWVARETFHLESAYAPWLLHKGPVGEALGICCGTGRSFGALLNIGIPVIDLVEINPAVIELSKKWFARSNHGVLTNPAARIIIDDGRNFVRYTKTKYDLITLEPLQMFQKGVVYFYTEDFYREARERMHKDGILCQWVPIYAMTEHEMRSIIKTFVAVFPNSVLWGGQNADLIILGYNNDETKVHLDDAEIAERLANPSVKDDLFSVWLANRFDPHMFILMDGQSLAAFGQPGQIYTDNHPALEYTAPRGREATRDNAALLLPHLTPPDKMFDLPHPDVTKYLTEIRRLTIQRLITPARKKELTEQMRSRYLEFYEDEKWKAVELRGTE